MRSTFAYSMASVCLAALTAPTHALAQSETAGPAQAASTASNEEIIVNARRRDELIQDVPAVVNAVTAEEITKLNLRDFTEVKNLVPGLQLTSATNGTGGNAQLRGVNFDINASGNNPTVEFYLNDAPITAGVILQQMYDVGQVEVLRGPQGTLRGRASPSGSITITTHKPDMYGFGGFADTTVNDLGTMNVQAGVNLPVIPGVAAIRVAGVINQDDGNRVRSIDRSYDARAPYTETKSGRVSAVVNPVEWLHLEGMYQRLDRNSRQWDQVESFSVVNPSAPPSSPLITADDREAIKARPNRVSQLYNIYNGRAEVAAAGQQLIYQFQHYTQDIESYLAQDDANIFPATDTYQHTVSHIKSTSHEVRLQNQARVLGMFDYVVGFFDNKNNTPTSLNQPTVVRLPLSFGGGIATVSQTPIQRLGTSHEQSYYGNLTAHVGEKFQLSGGLRYINYTDNGQLLVNGTVLTNDGQDDKKWIYSASAQYSFTPDVMVYASTGTSYRPGIYAVGDFNITPSALERSFLALDSETSRSYEIGLKSSFFDRRVRFNVSGYHQKFTNFPYRSPNSIYYLNTVAVRNAAGQVTGLTQQVGTFNFVAAVPVEVNGVEAEIGGNITSRWNMSVVASYSLGKIKDGTIPCNDLNRDGVPDVTTAAPTIAQLQAAVGTNNLSACTVTQRSAFLPPFTTTIQSDYSLPITHHIDGYLRALVNLSGKSQGDPTNAFDDVGSYGLVNLFGGIRDPKGMWEITIYAKNLFDENKVLTRTNALSTSYQQLGFAGQFDATGRPVFTGPTGATSTSTYTGITTTPLREFGLNLKFRFGSR